MDQAPLGMPALRRLHELIGQLNGSNSLDETLQAVVDGVVAIVGFEIAVVSLAHADGMLEAVAVAGNEEARAALLGHRLPIASWTAELDVADHWGKLRFVPHGRLPADQLIGWVPDFEPLDLPDAWHPLDALYAPLHSANGQLVGMLSVDLPNDRRLPGPVQRELLELFAGQAGIAVDNALVTQQLKTSEETFRLAFEGAGNGMALISLDPTDLGRYLRVNAALCAMVGRSAEQLLQGTFFDVTHPDDREDNRRALQLLLDGDRETLQVEKRYVHADGHAVWVSLTTSVVHGGGGAAEYLMSSIEDITERRVAEAELQHRAHHDPLTGLPNRRALAGRLARALAAAESTGQPGAVLFCDLDDFKRVNDSHGHACGDKVLAVIAERMAGVMRGSDSVIRLGGDEFIVVADALSGPEASALAQRLAEAVRAPVSVEGVVARVSVSIGIAPIPICDGDPKQLLKDADAAMYQAKAS